MNYKTILKTIGTVLSIEGTIMMLPLIVSFIYKDNEYLSFLIPGLALITIGIFLNIFLKNDKRSINSKEGFIIVGLSWVFMSLFGTLPYIISKTIPSFINALFETTSGFTTTGASILSSYEIDSLPYSITFYRSLTHFVGGMGVLVFVLAVIPKSNGKNIYFLKAESTGPKVSKFSSRLKDTAQILYLLYILFTVTEIILLVMDPNMNLFESINYAFSTAGTGGFSIYSDSCASLSTYSQIVITVFMFIFGINFNVFYFIIAGKILKGLKSEELISYVSIIIVAIIAVSIDLKVELKDTYISYGASLKDSAFQVVSFMTSTGFSNTLYNNFPQLSKTILVIVLFIGACSGSTGGGLKVSRLVILFKSISRSISKIMHPNSVKTIKFENEPVDSDMERDTLSYILCILLIFIVALVIVSIDGFDFETNFTAVACTINNTGLGFGSMLGNGGSFVEYSSLSKIVFVFIMLIGRLEIYPLLIIFNYKAWKN